MGEGINSSIFPTREKQPLKAPGICFGKTDLKKSGFRVKVGKDNFPGRWTLIQADGRLPGLSRKTQSGRLPGLSRKTRAGCLPGCEERKNRSAVFGF